MQYRRVSLEILWSCYVVADKIVALQPIPSSVIRSWGPLSSSMAIHQSSVSADVVDKRAVLTNELPSPKAEQRARAAIGQSPNVPLLQLALAGGATTFFADACIHPIDCIKTLQQSDLGAELNFVEAANYILETSGLRGFFQGLFTYACSDAVGGAFKFSFWETWKKKVTDPHLVWVGAALAFVVASVAIVPGEFLKQQLQMSHYETLAEAVHNIYLNDGITGFFIGYDAVIMRDVPHTILELCLYDILKRRAGSILPRAHNGSSRTVHPILAACLTGSIAGFLTTPMDTIKTKLMVEGCYDSVWDCFASTLDNYGWGGLWAGALARVLWIAPFTMLYLPSYDYLHKSLLERQYRVIDIHCSPSQPMNIDQDT